MIEYDVSNKIDVVKIVSKRPYTYKPLLKLTEVLLLSVKKHPFEASKQNIFDFTMADQIFDFMLDDRQIQFPQNVKLPSANDLKGKEYCKWHNSWWYITNNCMVFRNSLQKMIEK